MKRIILLLSIMQIIWATKLNLPEFQIDDWWVIAYSLKKAGTCKVTQGENVSFVRYPQSVYKFTITNIDTVNVIIKVEIPMSLLKKLPNERSDISKYVGWKLYVQRNSYRIIGAIKYTPQRTAKHDITYTKGDYIDNPFPLNNEVFISTINSMFAIPILFNDADSIVVSGPESLKYPDNYDSLASIYGSPTKEEWQRVPPILQKSRIGGIIFKNKRIAYREFNLNKGPLKISQIWIDDLPWWLHHENSGVKAELISSSFYSDEDIKALKELIKNDLEKRKSKEQ